MFFGNFCYFLCFSINFEEFWVTSGFPGLHFLMFFFEHLFCHVFLVHFLRNSKKGESWKVLKTLRLCIDLRVPMFEKNTRSCKKMLCFFFVFSLKINWKSSSKVRKTMSAAKIDKTSLPGTTFGAENCFLVDFRVPEGPQKWWALGTDPYAMLCYARSEGVWAEIW